MPRSSKKLPAVVFPFEKYRPMTSSYRSLLLKYPLFFKAVHEPEKLPCDLGHWGIRCGPGWLSILDVAIERIELELQAMTRGLDSFDFAMQVEQRIGEKSLVPVASEITMTEPLQTTTPTLLPYCREISVDELGGLQIGIASGYLCDEKNSHAIGGAVFFARMTAGKTCERCGGPGRKWDGYWRRIYCESCAGLRSVTEGDDGY